MVCILIQIPELYEHGSLRFALPVEQTTGVSPRASTSHGQLNLIYVIWTNSKVLTISSFLYQNYINEAQP